MKVKILLIAMLIAVGFSTSYAQQQNGQMPPRMSPDEMAKKQTEQMASDLKLNDKQKADVATINSKYAKQFGEIFQANQGNREVIHAKMQEANTQKSAELKKVLTEDQFKLYEDQEKKRMEEHHSRGGQPQGASDQQTVPNSK